MKTINLFHAAVFAMLASGCASDQPPQAAERKIVVSAPVAPVTPVEPAPAPIRTATEAKATFSVADEVNTKLRVAFISSGEEKGFAAKLARRLAAKVVVSKADIVLQEPCDMVINIAPEFEIIDKTREYYRVNCKQIDVTIRTARKIFAAMTCEVENLPRKLGLQNAKEQYLPQAVNEIAPFLGKELEKISNDHVAVSEINLTLANLQSRPEPRYVSAQVNRVAEILGSMSGVLNFTNVRQDVNKATCTFRVVYLKEQFPQGFANVLNAKLSGK